MKIRNLIYCLTQTNYYGMKVILETQFYEERFHIQNSFGKLNILIAILRDYAYASVPLKGYV